MVLEEDKRPLILQEIPLPQPTHEQVLVKISACGVCRTDLHIVDGDLRPPLPLIPGHQIVGTVEAAGKHVKHYKIGDRVGIPWLGKTCGQCIFCKSDRENLCDNALFTGYQVNGGFAEYCVADARYCFPLAPQLADLQVAPLLCAGLIGYRAYRMTGNAQRLGFYGFGSSAHILTQLARFEKREVFAFTREGDVETQSFARSLGASWAGGSDSSPPNPLDAAIIFAPVGALIPKALKVLRKGGIIVSAGIHMSEIPSFPYKDLWGERKIMSVANLTRRDGEDLLAIAPKVPIKTIVQTYRLEDANEALNDIRTGRLQGSAVLDLSLFGGKKL